MDAGKGAVLKITSIKLFICKIDIVERNSVGIKTDNFFMADDIIMELGKKFIFIFCVFKTMTWNFQKITIAVKGRERKMWTFRNHAAIQRVHSIMVRY